MKGRAGGLLGGQLEDGGRVVHVDVVALGAELELVPVGRDQPVEGVAHKQEGD